MDARHMPRLNSSTLPRGWSSLVCAARRNRMQFCPHAGIVTFPQPLRLTLASGDGEPKSVRAFTPAVILFIALPEEKDNIDPGVIPLALLPRQCPDLGYEFIATDYIPQVDSAFTAPRASCTMPSRSCQRSHFLFPASRKPKPTAFRAAAGGRKCPFASRLRLQPHLSTSPS